MTWAVAAAIALGVAVLEAVALLLWPEGQTTGWTVRVVVASALVDVAAVVAAVYVARLWVERWTLTRDYPRFAAVLEPFLRSRTATRLFAPSLLTVALLVLTILLGVVVGAWPVAYLAALAGLLGPLMLWVAALLSVAPVEPPPATGSEPPPPTQPSADWWTEIQADPGFRGQALFEQQLAAIGRPGSPDAPRVPVEDVDQSLLRRFRGLTGADPYPFQAEVLRAWSAAEPRSPLTLLCQGATGAGKSSVAASVALWRSSSHGARTLVVAATQGAAFTTASRLRRLVENSSIAPALRIGLLADLRLSTGDLSDVAVASWQDLHLALLDRQTARVRAWLADLAFVWIQDGGDLSGPVAAHASALIRRLDLACAGREPDVLVTSPGAIPDADRFIRMLSGRRNAGHVNAPARAGAARLITWQPTLLTDQRSTSGASGREFRPRPVRSELRELAAVLVRTFPDRGRRAPDILVFHPAVSISAPDRQAIRDAAGAAGLHFAVDGSELAAVAGTTRSDAVVVAGTFGLDGTVLEDVRGVLRPNGLLVIIPAPGAMAAAWAKEPVNVAALHDPVRTVPVGASGCLQVHLASTIASEGDGGLRMADLCRHFGDAAVVQRELEALVAAGWLTPFDPREGTDALVRLTARVAGVSTATILAGLPMDQVPSDVSDLPAVGATIRDAGPLGRRFLRPRVFELASAGTFLFREERLADGCFATQRYEVESAGRDDIVVQGPLEFALLRDEGIGNVQYTRVEPWLRVDTAAWPKSPGRPVSRWEPCRVTLACCGLRRYGALEDPGVADLVERDPSTWERDLSGWAFEFAAAGDGPGDLALWDVADLLSSAIGLVVRGSGERPSVATVERGAGRAVVRLVDLEGPGVGFSKLDPDDRRALGSRVLLMALVSVAACPCPDGCSRCLGTFSSSRPRELAGQHAKREVCRMLRAALDRGVSIPTFVEPWLRLLDGSTDETAALAWIRDHVSLPLMKARLGLCIDRVARLEVRPAPLRLGEQDVGGFYSSGDNVVVIRQGFDGARAEAIVTHEYAHNWQHDSPAHFPVMAPAWPEPDRTLLLEGFAQWVAHKVLQARGHVAEMSTIELRDGDEYGDGFDFYEALERDRGQDGVLRFAAQPEQMPHDELDSRLREARRV